ncbi:Co2+/Mg2+ efflux protein ApaG [Amphibiibacter pelophylacis]|uniref:Co2+/Mg2+ efflux protein ApaG n=1 Tax=Amphibiibacter pelophylacis TaxID=1799477 RepID=A0ACC6P202_9BURK
MSHPEFSCHVVVNPLHAETDPGQNRHAFAYTITVRNTGDVPAQLIARHWLIHDASGGTQEVRGLGVVGKQPMLSPGESFEYTSWAVIPTPQGSMEGSYLCITEAAETFEAAVPEFALARSQHLH